ncbi:MAG: hypothetical protein KAS66_08145 [Candidatus Omnitrophica bacterium]|nr:hypothetical protein [Candidatus Omnitrophota bacterium]
MIQSSEFGDDEFVHMQIKIANEETARRIRNKEPTGVSIECNSAGETPNNELRVFTGTGVSIIFYPDMPACPAKDGCGIAAKIKKPEHSLSGGIIISETEPKSTPGETKDPVIAGAMVSQEDFQKISAKLIETRQELQELRSSNVTEEYENNIKAKDAKIAELTNEIASRDTAIAASVIEDIVKLDPEFVAEGKSLPELQSIYASIQRVTEKIKATKEEPEPEEVPSGKSASFQAPSGSTPKDSLSIGGIIAGKWHGGNGNKPSSSVVARIGDQ